MDFYAVAIVALYLPQVLPATALSVLFLVFSIFLTSVAWALNIRSGLNVTPSYLRFLTVGTEVLFMMMLRKRLTSFVTRCKLGTC